jgi:hypothetical protein
MRNLSGEALETTRRRIGEISAKHPRKPPVRESGLRDAPRMETEQLKRVRLDLDALLTLVRTGASVIEELRKCIEGWKDFLDLEKSTEHQLRVSFCGLPLMFSLELTYAKDEIQGKVVAHHISYGAESKAQPLGVEYSFDRLGNMSKSTNRDDFAPYFLADVFEQIRQRGLVLRPGFQPEDQVVF